MGTRKKNIVVLCIFILSVVTLITLYILRMHEVTKPVTYPFLQARENIEKVEICAYDDETKTREPLVMISEDDTDTLLDEISALECHGYFRTPPPHMYGDLVILISYQNGEEELIGLEQVGWISPDGDETYTKYFFDIDAIWMVIAKYVDPEVLAEVSEYFR